MSGPAGVLDPAAEGWTRREGGGGFSALTGPYWERREAGGTAYGLLTEARHANGHGIVHGGLLVTLADNTLGLTVWEAGGRQPCVTVQLGVQFAEAVTPGAFVEARGEVLRLGGSLVLVRGRLTVGGRLVLSAEGVWKRLRAPLRAGQRPEDLPA